MSELVKVDFHGDTILAVAQADGKPPLVVLKPIVERLGVDWRNQLQRLKRDDLLAEGVVIITTPSPGGPQETVALPLNLLPGFLFGIDDSRVPDAEVRRMVQAYKRECHDVLYRHFFGAPAAPPDPTAGWAWDEIQHKIALVREVRLTSGQKAAQRLAVDIGLPGAIPAPAVAREGALQGVDFVRNFLAECTDEDEAGRVQARDLHRAYSEWAGRTQSPSMTERAFAMCLDALGTRKSRGGLHYYLGIRLKHRLERVD